MIRVLVSIMLAASLSGCAFFQGKAPGAPLLAGTQQSLYGLKSWRMDGRIGVQTSADAWQANLFWDHDPNQDRLRVSGPLSQGMVSIVMQKGLIFINLGDGHAELSRDPDALLRKHLGFSVPLPSLRYWILGVPDPDLAYTLIEEGGGSWGGFEQSGWRIAPDRFTDVGSHVLPQKMLVQGAGVRLKVIADNWEIKG